MAELALRFENVAFSWDTAHPMLVITLAIGPTECAALVGRNGAGKSTLFKLACGRPPQAGRICVGDLDTATARAPRSWLAAYR